MTNQIDITVLPERLCRANAALGWTTNTLQPFGLDKL
jgi:hypothetical protein